MPTARPAEPGCSSRPGSTRRTTTRLLDGEFPKYRSLLPSESSAIADVETAQLTDAVKRVALVAERNTPVRLAFEGSELTLRAGAGDEGVRGDVDRPRG